MAYYLKPSALADLKRLPKLAQRRIVGKLDFYTKSSEPLRFAKMLTYKAFGQYRFRVGDYRIIFDFDEKRKIVIVLAIGHRKDIYQ